MRLAYYVIRPAYVFFVSASIFFASAYPAVASDWEDIVKKAKGQTVDWFMYGGFPSTNTYVNNYVAEEMKKRYDITVKQVPVRDIAQVVGKLLVEKQADKNENGEVDFMWINGENFRTCKKNGLLFGPFADRLPNKILVDWKSPSVSNDFGEPVEYMESPWGGAQVVFAYDTKRTPEPPKTMGELLEWIRSHPGRFTYPAPPDFTGSVFIRHVFYHVAGDVNIWQGNFDQARFEKAARDCYDKLFEISPYLWREGKTYPESPIRLSHLFVDGEVDFVMSYNPSEASKRILDGLYPKSVKTFVFEDGTIANTHFTAIPFNAMDKEGAMVLADFLLSPEAQLKKADPGVWGDLPAIDTTRLSDNMKRAFAELPKGPATLDDVILKSHQLPELPSELLIRLEKGWDDHVLKRR